MKRTGKLNQTMSTGCYTYTLTGTDNVGNTVSVSTIVEVDTSAPTAVGLAFTDLSANALWSTGQSTLYIRPSGGGTFTVTGSSTDDQSGIKSGNAGWTFATLNANGGANFGETQSGDHVDYTFGATTTVPSTARSVAANNRAGLSTSSSYSVVADTNAPAGGALAVNGTSATGAGSTSYSTDGSFAVGTLTQYTEAQSATESGLASSSLVRTQASFSSPDTCGSFGSPTTINGPAPVSQNLTTGCYRYTLTGVDAVGNTVSISTTVKVDTTDPTISLALASGTGDAYWPGSGSRVFFRPAGSRQVDVDATVADGDTGIATTTFPTTGSMGANWSVRGRGTSRTYAYTATGGTPGVQTVTTQNGASRSSSASITVTADSTAPTGGALRIH